MTPQLTPETIHIWCVDYNNAINSKQLEMCRKILNNDEIQKEKKFYFEHDRRRYLITRATLRNILSLYVPIKPDDWIFKTNQYGRPYINNVQHCAQTIYFNISHTKSLIIIGVTHSSPIGVDVENFNANRDITNISYYFTQNEQDFIRSLPAQQRQRIFYDYWTLKESYIKARGMGLSIPLDSFSFALENHGLEFNAHPHLDDKPDNWRFWQLQIAPNYVAAICARRRLGAPQNLILKKISPIFAEEPVDYAITRTTPT
jgi:4'-phosphopantetheinyl transferase